MRAIKNKQTETCNVYLVGGGIASLASAVYLINEAKVKGENIHIMEQSNIIGGSLDGIGEVEKGFMIRGGRMHEAHFGCYWDLLSNIPSFDNPEISVTAETFELNKIYVSNAKARLLRDGKILDVSSFGLDKKSRHDILKLTLTSEKKLGNKRIKDWFSPEFFQTKFWLIWTTMFAFQTWSSLVEMRRYCNRFIHLLPFMEKLGGILRTKYNQYDAVVRPLERWLKERGVKFELNMQVTDVDFNITKESKTANAIHYKLPQGDKGKISLSENDCVFITLGSITDAADIGSMTSAPKLNDVSASGSWLLWKKIAEKDPSFGNPGVFCDQIDLQKWESFTVTLKDPTFFEHMIDFTGNIPGTGGLVTMTDSNWLMSVVLALQPHFSNQPADVQVFWGYGLYPDKTGNFIKKKMSECSGKEILMELFYHLKITDKMTPILETGKINCLPCMMPFIDSLFMPRNLGDRPKVVPEGAANFAFLGQFVEAPKDCVFTVEYSVRCAQMAVFSLFNTNRKVIPVYPSRYKPSVLYKAIKALKR